MNNNLNIKNNENVSNVSNNLNDFSFIKPLNNNQIKLNNLYNEYNIVLNQYEELMKNVINNNKSLNNLINLKNNVFWGQYGLSQGKVNSIKDCENMCLNNSKCSGATYSSKDSFCYIRSGDGSLGPGLETDYAIIPNYKYNLLNLQTLNEKLLDLNNEINKIINDSNVYLNQLDENKNIQQDKLLNNYQVLLDEKNKINNMLREYDDIEKSYNDSYIEVEKNNGLYNIWIILTIIIVILMFKLVFEIELLFLGIIILLIVLTYLLANPWGFFIWGLILIIFIYSRL